VVVGYACLIGEERVMAAEYLFLSRVPYCLVMCSTVQYSTVQYSTVMLCVLVLCAYFTVFVLLSFMPPVACAVVNWPDTFLSSFV
jgi:hypothetical protein